MVTVLLTGCAATTTGRAEPAPGTRSNTSTPSAAPKVTHPLDASTVVAKPCASLSRRDVIGLGFTDPTSSADRDANGTGCSWAGEAGGAIAISWDTANTHGLADLYAKKSTYSYWIPTSIAGYPAVYGDGLGDLRADGNCIVNVGVSDQLAFFAMYDDPADAPSACSLAGKAAADVIATLKAGT
ncbi:MAG TPA: DUF3558 domain-containing protein [Pseudonocardiaceae bacterium]